jgi:hypothetical protein
VKKLIYPWLEKAFGGLARWVENRRHQFSICPECGRNRYTGKPCRNDYGGDRNFYRGNHKEG